MYSFCRENEPGWDDDIRNDVLEEVSKLGSVVHIRVDSTDPEVMSLTGFFFKSYLIVNANFISWLRGANGSYQLPMKTGDRVGWRSSFSSAIFEQSTRTEC